MATCIYCGKGPAVGNNVSHSNRRTKRWLHANIQKVRAVINGSTRRISVCTSCIRSGLVGKP